MTRQISQILTIVTLLTATFYFAHPAATDGQAHRPPPPEPPREGEINGGGSNPKELLELLLEQNKRLKLENEKLQTQLGDLKAKKPANQ
jgi:hypothetical protein